MDLNTVAYITIDRRKLPLPEVLAWTQCSCYTFICHRWHGNYYGNDLIDFVFESTETGLKDITLFALRWL